jgi:hypothetical protein
MDRSLSEHVGPAVNSASAAPRPRRALAIAVLVASALLLWAPYRNFTTDDAFIHYRFARNLAGGEGFSFNPGTPTYGDTSPLWVLAVAGLGDRLVAWGVAPRSPADATAGGLVDGADAWRLASKLIAFVALVAAVVLFYAIAARRFPIPRWSGFVVTLLFILDPWLIKWGLSGMETALAVAVGLLAWWLRDRHRNCGRLDPWTPLVLGLGALVRPEVVLLLIALIADVALSERRRRTGDLVLTLVLSAIVALPWLIYADRTFGTLVPNTLAARRDVNYSMLYIMGKMGTILASTYLIPFVGCGWAIVRARASRSALVFPLLAVGLVLGFYLLWHVSVGARYLLLVTPFITLIGYGTLVEGLRPAWRNACLVMAAAALIAVQWGAVRFVTRWPLGLDARLFEVAQYLATQTPEDAVVAAHEIGVIGHVGDRKIVDLAGLVSPDLVPFSRTGSVARSLADRPVDYLVWNSNLSPDRWLLEDMEGRLDPVLVRKVHREGSSHLGGWQYYTIYRVSEPGHEP